MAIDWDKVREDDNDHTTTELLAEVVRGMLAKGKVNEVVTLAAYALANAGDKDHQSTAAAYDSDLDALAEGVANHTLDRIWADRWDERMDISAQNKFDMKRD